MIELYVFGLTGILLIAMLLAFVLAGKWLIIGIKLYIARFRYKDNAGILLLVNKAGAIGKLIPINLNAERYEIKMPKGQESKHFTYSKEQLQKGTFFGFPFIIMVDDDTKTTVGWYYHQSDPETHQPLYYDAEKQIPVLSPIKDSVSMPPSYFDALVSDHVLTMALKDFMASNSKIILIVSGGAIAAAAAAFFGFDMINTHMPAIMQQLQGISANTAEILSLIREVTA